MARNVRESKEVYKDDRFIVWEGRSLDNGYTAIFNISDSLQHDIPVTIKQGSIEMWTGRVLNDLDDMSIAPHAVIALMTE